jgi:hypothetical protein
VVVLPVWCEGWALGCCGDDNPATTGSPWRPSLVVSLFGDHPYDQTTADLGWTATDDGEVILVGEMHVDDTGSPQPIIDLGSIRVAARLLGIPVIEGRFTTTTRIYCDWHADIDPPLMEEVAVEGVVLQVFAYKSVYDPAGESGMRFHEEAVEVGTTCGWLGGDALVRLDVRP